VVVAAAYRTRAARPLLPLHCAAPRDGL